MKVSIDLCRRTSCRVAGALLAFHLVTVPAAAQQAGMRVEGVETPLYDQTDSPAGNGVESQNFEALHDALDCQAADDFVVPPGQSWQVERVEVLGFYSAGGGPVAGVDIEIFTDGPGLPDDEIYSKESVAVAAESGGNLTVDLPVAAVLPPGTYWLSVRAHMDLGTLGQWYWSTRIPDSGSAYAWRNPDDGWGADCAIWRSAVFCGRPDDGGLRFRIWGQQIGGACNSEPEAVDSVPPEGWSVVDAITPGPTWTTSTAHAYGNFTGGAGVAATASSDAFGVAPFDTELRSPPFDLVGWSSSQVRFRVNFQQAAPTERLDLDVTDDSFVTWTTVLSLTDDAGAFFAAPGVLAVVDLSLFVERTGLQARWRYWDHDVAADGWYAQVDDISLLCGLFLDSFESGNTSKWSQTVP